MQANKLLQLTLSAAIMAVLLPRFALAQQTPAAAVTAQQKKDTANDAAASTDPARSLEEVVVTGAASSSGVKKLDASYSITTANPEQIKEALPSSSADLLKIVPGLWVESSGGQTGPNIFVRGFPGTGDAPYTTMELDGSPVFPVPTLSFLDNSSLFRLDDTIERTEVLVGGPSVIFSSGQMGATANFIQKQGTEKSEGSIGLSLGSEGLYRLDGYFGGKISDGWYFSVGGFYRTSDGIRDSQFPADKGGQLSATLTHTMDNGTLMFYARSLDDKNLFITDVPLISTNGGKDIHAFPGFDPGSDTFAGNALRLATLQVTPGATPGTITRDLADGRGADIHMFGSNLDLDLNGWSLSNKFNFTGGNAPTNALFNDGNPERLGDFINSAIGSANGNAAVVAAAGKQATGGTATYVNGGGPVDLNQQVAQLGFWVVDKQIRSFSDELRFAHELFEGNTLTFGAYFASYSATDNWFLGNNMLVTATPNAQPINLGLDNGAIVSHNGFTSGSFFNLHASYDGRNEAAFLLDEWKIGDWRIDAGARLERQKIDGSIENSSSVDLDGNPLTLYNNGASVVNGTYTPVDYNKSAHSWTVGANYELSSTMSVYARVNDGFHFPSFDDLRSDTPNLQKVKTAEVGFKTATELYNAYITAFTNKFDGVPFQAFDLNGNNITSVGGSKAHGVEFQGVLHPLEHLSLALTGDWQHGTYSDYGVITGNQVQRQPKLQYRFTPSYDIPMGWGDLKLFATYTNIGKRFSDLQNEQPLPGYYTLDLGAVAEVGQNVELRLSGTNVTNQFGLTEGNARIQGADTASNGVFLGRPIFGREYMFEVKYKF